MLWVVDPSMETVNSLEDLFDMFQGGTFGDDYSLCEICMIVDSNLNSMFIINLGIQNNARESCKEIVNVVLPVLPNDCPTHLTGFRDMLCQNTVSLNVHTSDMNHDEVCAFISLFGPKLQRVMFFNSENVSNIQQELIKNNLRVYRMSIICDTDVHMVEIISDKSGHTAATVYDITLYVHYNAEASILQLIDSLKKLPETCSFQINFRMYFPAIDSTAIFGSGICNRRMNCIAVTHSIYYAVNSTNEPLYVICKDSEEQLTHLLSVRYMFDVLASSVNKQYQRFEYGNLKIGGLSFNIQHVSDKARNMLYALYMGLHHRLGLKSPLYLLGTDLLNTIIMKLID
jgi:hypothetical protein